MESKLMTSKEVTKVLYKNLRDFLKDKKRIPNIIDISVGNDFGGEMYAKMKQKKIEAETGIGFKSVHFDEISVGSLLGYIDDLNKDSSIDGIMIQLPLPGELHKYESTIIEAINPKKDVDGLTQASMGKLMGGKPTYIACTALGIETLLKSYDVDLDGSVVGIINRSSVVGKPLAHLMLRNNATPIICHSHTKDLPHITNKCDIVIAALNQKEFIKPMHIKGGAVVVDVGVHKNEEGKTVGDIDLNSLIGRASLITPPTGAVGPMTICMLAYNAVRSNYGEDVDKLLESGIDDCKKLIMKQR